MLLMTEETELRAAVAALGEAKTARRYDDALRRRIVRHARARARAGATAKEIAASLDVSVLSLQRFLEQIPELVPVTLVDAEPQGDAPTLGVPTRRVPPLSALVPSDQPAGLAPPRVLMVHGPGGLRAEGLSLDDVVLLFQRMATCSA